MPARPVLIPCLSGPDWRAQREGGGVIGMKGSGSGGGAEAMRGIIFGEARRVESAIPLLPAAKSRRHRLVSFAWACA